MTDRTYKLVMLPERSTWLQVTGRDGKQFTDGWNACLDAIAATAPEPVCKWKFHEGHDPFWSSLCGYRCEWLSGGPREWHFCPNCGKKVEVVGDE